MSRLNSETAKLETKCPKCGQETTLGMCSEDYNSADAKTFCHCSNCGHRVAIVSHVFKYVCFYVSGEIIYFDT